MHIPQRILVTGGAGFIGTNYLLLAVPRHPDVQFVNLDAVTYAGRPSNLAAIDPLPNYRFIRGDIADAELVDGLFKEHRFTTVVHFAAESHVDRSITDPLAFVRTNVLGTATLLDVARKHWTEPGADVRFHHVSTDEVYGSLSDEGLFTEETPYDPRSPYAASKAGSDHLVRAYFHTFGLPIVISNASNNYGPYQYPEKLIPLVIRNAVLRQDVPIYGEGRNVRDWLHVEDHCEAIDLMLRTALVGRTYLVSGGAERRNRSLVEELLDFVDESLGRPTGESRELITFVRDRPGHDFRYALDGTRIAEELAWRPRHDLRTGLRATVKWYLDHPDWLASADDDAFRSWYKTQYAKR